MPIYNHSISYINGEIFGGKFTIPQFKKGLTYHVDLCYIPLLNEFVLNIRNILEVTPCPMFLFMLTLSFCANVAKFNNQGPKLKIRHE
jgi:hypothetical protein